MREEKDNLVSFNGKVTDALGGGFYNVKIKDGATEHEVKVKLKGRLKHNKIRVLPGDSVIVGLSVHDMKNGFITRRLK